MKYFRIRIMVEALGAALVAAVIILAAQVALGMINTVTHVPDIVSSYESVDNLQQEVAFGQIRGGNWIFEGAVCFIAAVVYYGVRVLFQTRRR